MKWLTETRATRRSLAEIGMLVVIREVFGNALAMTRREADDTLGPGWMALAKELDKAGGKAAPDGRARAHERRRRRRPQA